MRTLEDNESMYESIYESEESESDDSYLYDSDYYNNRARIKRKMYQFKLTKDEKKEITNFKPYRYMKGNNLPFWQLIFDYLGLEDIEKVMLC